MIKNRIPFQKFLQKISDWVLPWTCVLCGKNSTTRQDLCSACKKSLPWIKKACWQCSSKLEATSTKSYCGECLQQTKIFTRTIALFHYQQPITPWITGLKFNHRLVYAKLMGELLAEQLLQHYQQDSWPELIIPVPLHFERLRERGFNQAIEIAHPIARRYNLPVNKTLCRRLRSTQAQSTLSGKDRYQNVKNAFSINTKISAKHVIVLDDVMTTGNTANEIAKCLKKSGAARIDVWCCARV